MPTFPPLWSIKNYAILQYFMCVFFLMSRPTLLIIKAVPNYTVQGFVNQCHYLPSSTVKRTVFYGHCSSWGSAETREAACTRGDEETKRGAPWTVSLSWLEMNPFWFFCFFRWFWRVCVCIYFSCKDTLPKSFIDWIFEGSV